MRDFFISYAQRDRGWAEWIAWQLEAAGYTTILQAWDFRPGANFVREMARASEAETTVAVISPDYLASLFTQSEWAAAFAADPGGQKGKLLPIRVAECELTGLLKAIVYIDLLDRSEGDAKQTLLAGVKAERRKPSTAPSFPNFGNVPPNFPSNPTVQPPKSAGPYF